MTFEVGTQVIKPSGYPYPGTVVAVFENLAGDTRLVVESELAPGMLHIFTPNQLQVYTGLCGVGGPPEAVSDCVLLEGHATHIIEHEDSAGGTWRYAERPRYR